MGTLEKHWKMKESTKRKIGLANSVSQLGKKHREETKVKISNALKGDNNPMKKIENRLKMSQIHKAKGVNHHAWKGGVTVPNELARKSQEYRLWRESVFKRDNYTCQECGVRGGCGKKVVLNADHIKPFAWFPELRYAIDNGRTLCIYCHKKTPTYGTNGNKAVEYLKEITNP